ncbi:hypothetical protein [Thiomicrorhabdus sp.]
MVAPVVITSSIKATFRTPAKYSPFTENARLRFVCLWRRLKFV